MKSSETKTRNDDFGVQNYKCLDVNKTDKISKIKSAPWAAFTCNIFTLCDIWLNFLPEIDRNAFIIFVVVAVIYFADRDSAVEETETTTERHVSRCDTCEPTKRLKLLELHDVLRYDWITVGSVLHKLHRKQKSSSVHRSHWIVVADIFVKSPSNWEISNNLQVYKSCDPKTERGREKHSKSFVHLNFEVQLAAVKQFL